MAEVTPPFAPLQRVSSGVQGLDIVLQGGLLRGGMYMIEGSPGTGKTTLANQTCFHHIRTGGRVVYVSLLSENHSRLFAHLQGFSFFDRNLIGDTLQYFSAYAELDARGLDGLTAFVRQTIRQERATLVVIDGFENVRYIAENRLVIKRFMHQLHTYSETFNSTLLLLTQPGDYYASDMTMADGVIQLSNEAVDLRRARTMEVLKLRGSDYLTGKHLVRITNDGLVIHPRTESVRWATRKQQSQVRQRLSLGVPSLDDMLYGGLLSESTTMLLGTPGSGKTLLGLHFLAAGARAGEPSLYFGMFEDPVRLQHKANQIGLDFTDALRQGTLDILWQWPREDVIDVYVERLVATVQQRGIKRVFIDSIDGLRHTIYSERLPAVFSALLDELSAQGVTIIFAAEMPQVVGVAIEMPAYEQLIPIDNIMLLRYVELRSQLYRLISILKIRDSAYDTAIREFTISQQGIDVASTFASAEAILTGVARPLPETSVIAIPNERASRKRRTPPK